MYYFKEPLKALMTKKRVSQRNLVASVDVSQGLVTKLMNDEGCQTVDLHKLTLIADYLGVKPWKLIRDAQ